MLNALIFDFDGLILDTETPEYLTWQVIYREFGLELDPQIWGQFVGGTGASDYHPLPHLERLLGYDLDRSALEARARFESLERIDQQPLCEGVLETLEQAKLLGLKLAVASSSHHDWVDGHLKRLGLFEYFQAVICADDVAPGRTKPQPDLFLLALKTLSVSANQAIVLEDSPNGVLAANRAGIFVVAIPNPLTALLPMVGENIRLSSMAHLKLADLSARFE